MFSYRTMVKVDPSPAPIRGHEEHPGAFLVLAEKVLLHFRLGDLDLRAAGCGEKKLPFRGRLLAG